MDGYIPGKDHKRDGKSFFHGQEPDYGHEMGFTVSVIPADEPHLGPALGNVIFQVVFDIREPFLPTHGKYRHIFHRHTALAQLFDNGSGLEGFEFFEGVQ